MSAVYRPMSISKNFRLAPLVLKLAIHNIFFKNLILIFLFFTQKIGIWGMHLYVSDTLFILKEIILYFDTNHPLFGNLLVAILYVAKAITLVATTDSMSKI